MKVVKKIKGSEKLWRLLRASSKHEWLPALGERTCLQHSCLVRLAKKNCKAVKTGGEGDLDADCTCAAG